MEECRKSTDRLIDLLVVNGLVLTGNSDRPSGREWFGTNR